MKGHRLQATALLLGAIGASLFPGAVRADEPKPGTPPVVVITGDTLTINDTKVDLPIEREAFIKILGKPSREAKLANTILTWDDLGVFVYQYPGESTLIHGVALALGGKENISFWPKKPFSGKLTIDGAPVEAKMTVKMVNDKKKEPLFKKHDILDNHYVIDQPGSKMMIFLETSKGSDGNFLQLTFETREKKK
jgi:hypothetical protein